MMRLLANLTATFVLVLLLAAPGVFSVNLVDFEPGVSGIAVYENSEKFGEFLQISKIGGNYFKVDFKTFAEKPALYKNILTIENKKDLKVTIRIVAGDGEAELFFNQNSDTEGPPEVKLQPGQKTEINLLAPVGESNLKSVNFSLEISE